jgi:Sensors of blue-light using FAD
MNAFESTLPDTQPGDVDTQRDKPRLGQMLVCSLVCGKPTAEQLRSLADQSTQNNRNRGITGVLLCGNGVFVHWLEGLDRYVDQAWQSIAKDPRHENIVVLWHSHEAKDRLFGDWVMGLRKTIVAQDLLALLQVVQQQQTPKAMLRTGYYEVFSEALSLLQRVCAPEANIGLAQSAMPAYKVIGPTRAVLKAMLRTPFTPHMASAGKAAKNAAYSSELSSLHTDASSVFKNSAPMEHAALIDLAAEGMDDLLTMLDMPLRWALGKELWSRRKELALKPLHWTYEDKLVAVFDHKSWRVGMHPELTNVAYEQTVVTERLRSANDIPTQFRQTTAYALFWDYALSGESKDLKLPSRFLSGRIRLRRMPPVSETALTHLQQRLLAIMGKGPEPLGDLAQVLELTIERIAHEMRPFYAARCIEVVVK